MNVYASLELNFTKRTAIPFQTTQSNTALRSITIYLS